MKKIKCAVVGYGDRGFCYAEYATQKPDELEIVAVVDPNPVRQDIAKVKFGLNEKQIYTDLDAFLADKVEADVVINATMDNLHYETAMKLLDNDYNLLLEKPITSNPKELFDIQKTAEKKGLKVVICHVLRYTPFYRKIKEIIDSGKIGKVVDMQLNEHVWHGHFVNAYVRGKWRSEKECGSGFLIAKCCHDTDLMCWLNNATVPTEVSSFGSRATYCPENAPKGATEYCYDCSHKDICVFDAMRFELVMDCCPQYTWASLKKPTSEITEEEKIAFLKKDVYGKCVYNTGMDIVDRQCVAVNFANGSIGTLNMVGGASKAGRHIHVICEYGEIIGYIEDNKIIYREYNKELSNIKYLNDDMTHADTVIEIGEDFSDKDNSVTGHYGGDYYIMKDLVRFLNGAATSVSTTTIADSVNSHLICYAAEESRLNKKIVNLQETYGK